MRVQIWLNGCKSAKNRDEVDDSIIDFLHKPSHLRLFLQMYRISVYGNLVLCTNFYRTCQKLVQKLKN